MELLDRLDASKIDFVTDFSDPLPVTVIAEMLGIPGEDRKRFKKWSDNEIGSSEESPESRRRTHIELARYFSKIIEERKKNPRSDLISSIVTSEVDGQRLTESEAVSFCILLLIAGNETTTNLLGNAIPAFRALPNPGKAMKNSPSSRVRSRRFCVCSLAGSRHVPDRD